MRNSRSRVMLALLTTLATIGLFAPGASAQDTSEVYVVHGIPGVTVDVYVNGDLTLEGFEPEAIAGPLSLPAADYQIQIFAAADDAPATADERDDDAVIDVTPSVPGGANLSVVAHLDADGAPTLAAFVNDLDTIDAGEGKVTVRHTAAAPTVDIVAGGAAVDGLTGLSNGEEAVVALPADSYPTGIAAAGTTEALVDAPITIAEGTNLVVYAIGDLAGGSFTLITQSFDGLHSAPAQVNAGTSGLLAPTGPSAGPALVVIGLLGVAALAGTARASMVRR